VFEWFHQSQIFNDRRFILNYDQSYENQSSNHYLVILNKNISIKVVLIT